MFGAVIAEIIRKIAKLIWYFFPENYRKEWHENADIDLYFRRTMMVGFSVISMFVMLPMFLYHSLFLSSSSFLFYSYSFVFVLYVIFLQQFKKHGKEWPFLVALYYLGLFHYPARAFFYDGIESWPMLLWVFNIYLIARFTTHRSAAFILLFVGTFSIFLTNMENHGMMNSFELGQFWFRYFGASIMLFVIVSTKDRVEKIMKDQLKKNASQQNARQMIASLNHEINNPLMIAVGSIDHFRATKDEKYLERIDRSLNRVTEILRKIRQLENLQSTNYTETLKMIDFGISSEVFDEKDSANTEQPSEPETKNSSPKTKEDWEKLLMDELKKE